MKKDDFNVYEFHQQLLKMIPGENLLLLQKSLDDIKSKPSITFEDELQTKQHIKEIEQKINFISSFTEFNELSEEIVNQFNQLLNCTIKDTFMKKKKSGSEINNQKKELISNYLEIIKNFSFLLYLLPKFEEEHMKLYNCQDCNVELEPYDHCMICPVCCCEQSHLYQDETISYKDLSRINTNVKYSYIRQTHFRDTIKQFQGKQNKFIDEKIYKTLYKCFEDSGIKPMPNGKYNVSKDNIKMYLQENSFYKYYEDINLIYFEITGIPCPDITIYEKQLIDDFDKFVVVYDKVITNDFSCYNRSNILNSYYILFQLLKKNGYACKESDFPIIKTIDRKIEHDEIYEKCCKQLGWFFYPTV
jgi:hypothetical protein